MVIRARYILLLLFCQVCLSLVGQEYYVNTRDIGVKQGLSHYKVLSFYPEKEGMWIGTEDGLNFYDGYNWKYWTQDKGQLESKAVNFIQKDQDNTLWLFNTQRIDKRKFIQSIDLLMADRDSVISFKQQFGNQVPFQISAVENFFEDQTQRLYFFANDQLWRYTPTSLFKKIHLPQGFEPFTIFPDGTYVGRMKDKLVTVSSQGVLLYTSNYTLNDNLYSIVGNQHQFWFYQDSSPGQRFERSADGSYQSTLFPLQKEGYEIFSFLYFDAKQNHVWVNKGEYTYLYDTNGNQLYQHEYASRVALSDENGNLWLGKFEASILRLQTKKFKTYLQKDQKTKGFNDMYQCRGILEKQGKLYVNTYKGLNVIDLETEEVLPSPPEIGVNFGILNDRNNQIWMAYRHLFQLDESDIQIANTFKIPKPSLKIWSLFEDREDRIWMGDIGLSYLDEGKIKHFEKYNDFEELAQGLILFFYKDKNGVIWIGSNKGLFQLDLKKGIIAGYGKHKKGAFHLPTNKFQHMYQDAQGIFWLTTEDVGLLRWNKATGDLQQFDKSFGMPSSNIYSVYEDDFGYLWLSTFDGIVRFQKDAKSISIYNEEDGISGSEFNRISHHQAADGTLYFGGQNGVTSFHPKDFLNEKSNKKEFELAVKYTTAFGLKTFRDTASEHASINLTHLGPAIRVIDLEIACSDIFWTDKVDLHYTLEHLNKSQKVTNTSRENISTNNHVELFGMNPGRYQLYIKAVQKNGKQLGETIVVPIRIARPILHQPFFWLLISLAAGLGFWGFMVFRTARLRKRQAELETLVKERALQILEDQKTIQTQAKQIEVMKDQLNRKDELWLEQFQSIINERLDDPDLYLPDIIDEMDISRSIFYEKVKMFTKMTPNQYIQELRLNKAKAILDEGQLKTVKEVAYAIGMKRPSYFSKLFKERFGILPSTYFRDHKN